MFSRGNIWDLEVKIALIGYGNMGCILKQLAEAKGNEIVSIIDPKAAGATAREITANSLNNADVCIDFSQPDCAIENIRKLSELKKNIVVGTTGWYDRTEEAKKIILKSGNGLVFASNFSLGVNLFYKIIERSSELFNNFSEYDVYGIEFHHNRKKDSPSGTAKTIAKKIVDNCKRKTRMVFDKLDRQIFADELHFASVRGGSVPGTHSVFFDSNSDTIELTHIARSREGFALGALKAAEWINGKKGFYSIDDMMNEIIK